MAGGAVFQHIEHPSIHNISTFDKKVILSNSSHHNLADLSKLKENIDYKLLAWAEGISNIHIDGYGDNVPCPKEPEVVYYPKINFLAFQNHNEWTLDNPEFTDMISWSKDIFEKFLNNNL